jgi:hypothetical protein
MGGERITRLLSYSTTFVPVIHSLTERSCRSQKRIVSPAKMTSQIRERIRDLPKSVGP